MNADEIEKAKEIVRLLRDYASDCDDDEACFQCTFACVCDKCGNNAPKIIADLIENLTSQLAESERKEKEDAELIRKIYLTSNKYFSESCRNIVRMIGAWNDKKGSDNGN